MAELTTMNMYKFNNLCYNTKLGKTAAVLAAVDQNPNLVTTADSCDNTLLHHASNDLLDNPYLVKCLLERGANVHTRSILGYDALMYASRNGLVRTCTVLLDHGADPNSNNKYWSALSIAASRRNLQVCILLISRGANLMLVLNNRTALEKYGIDNWVKLTPDKLEQCREILRNAFNIEERWKHRWPMMSVMTGCGFRPLKAKLLELILQRDIRSAAGELPLPIVIDTPEKRRAYYMGMVFGNDGLLRLIVLYL